MRERGVVEPADQHLLVPGPDDVGVAAVCDEQEPRLERGAGPAHGEVALVRLHRGDHDPVGQLQIARVEAALEHDRPLDQVDDLLELAPGISPGAGGVEAGHDRRAPLGRLGHRPHAAQVVQVGRGGAQARVAALVAMAVGGFTALQAEQAHRHDGVVELHDEPAHRAREAAALVAHRLGELDPLGEAADDVRHEVGDLRGRAFGYRPHEPVPPLECGRVEAVLAREPVQRLVGRIGARPAHLGALGGPLGREAERDRSQSPGGDVDAPLGGDNPGFRKARLEQAGQLRLGLAARRRRQLLAAELDEEIRHRPPPPPGGCARPPARVAASAGCSRPGR